MTRPLRLALWLVGCVLLASLIYAAVVWIAGFPPVVGWAVSFAAGWQTNTVMERRGVW